MSNLNPDQFNSSGYKMPRQEDYNYEDDYQRDLKRWHRAQAGKTKGGFVDPEVEKMRAASAREAKEEYKPVAEARAAKRKQVNQTFSMVSKGLSAMGMKPKGRRRWK